MFTYFDNGLTYIEADPSFVRKWVVAEKNSSLTKMVFEAIFHRFVLVRYIYTNWTITRMFYGNIETYGIGYDVNNLTESTSQR